MYREVPLSACMLSEVEPVKKLAEIATPERRSPFFCLRAFIVDDLG